MAVMPLVPETKMADVGKLISFGNMLVRKVMWLVLTTSSATLVSSHAFGADCMTRIAYIYSRPPSTHSLTFFTSSDSTLSLSYILTSRSQPHENVLFCNFFFLVLPFRLDFFQPRTQHRNFVKLRKRQPTNMGEDTFLLRHVVLFLYIDTLHEILSPHTFYSRHDTLNI